MNVHDEKVIRKMIEHTEHILQYIHGCDTLEQFTADSMRVEACVFNLVQIGELAHSELSNETKDIIVSIPWNQIYGMRNRIVHGYEEVSMAVVWETASTDIAALKKELEDSLKD